MQCITNCSLTEAQKLSRRPDRTPVVSPAALRHTCDNSYRHKRFIAESAARTQGQVVAGPLCSHGTPLRHQKAASVRVTPEVLEVLLQLL
jgi:hypothetical protein